MFSPPDFESAPAPTGQQSTDNTNQGSNSNNTYIEPFSRNRLRSTMPTNIRHSDVPKTPRTNPFISRFHNNYCPSPSAASNSTTFAEPWISTIVESPAPASEQSNKGNSNSSGLAPPLSESRRKPLRRSVSALTSKPDQAAAASEHSKNVAAEEKRPIINFGSFKQKVLKGWNNSNKKKDNKSRKGSPMPPPFPTNSTSSGPGKPQSPQNTHNSHKPQNPKPPSTSKPAALPSKVSPGRMQLEDKQKYFKKVGMKQNMKMTNVQRMQKERQRDFKLVPEPGRKRLSTESTQDPTYARIDSMVILESQSPSKKSCPSITGSECEKVIMRNNRDKKNGQGRFDMETRSMNTTSLIMPLTSTPKTYGPNGSRPTSATFEVSKLASPSNSSLCLLGGEDEGFQNQQNATMYFSTHALLSAPGYTAVVKKEPEEDVAPINSSNSRNALTNGTEMTRNDDNSSPSSFTSSSQCPSIPSTASEMPNQNQMAELWLVSKQLNEKKQLVDGARPMFSMMKTRMIEITTEQTKLMQIDDPTVEEMRRFWLLGKENLEVCGKLNNLEMQTSDAENAIAYLKMRRDSLLNSTSSSSSAGFGMETSVSEC